MAANRDGNSSRPKWRGHALVLGLLAAALAVIFRADLFSGSDLFFKAYRDVNPLTAWYPWSRLELESWRQGLFPLWNPYNLLGHPLAANYQSAVFSPLLWPLVFGPLEAIVVPYLLARLMFAGWGTYLFCRRINMGKTGSTASALAFGLTGYLTQYVNNEHVVIDILLPFLLLSGDHLARDRRARWFLAHVAITALVLLGGQPGAALFTLALGYGYAGFAALTRFDHKFSSLMPILVAGGAALVIALIQLLPFLEFVPRAWTFHTPDFGAEHLPLRGLVTLVAPGFFGPLDVANRHILLLHLAPYLGVVPAVLAGAAALSPRGRHRLFFTAVLVTALGLMAGVPPFAWIGQLPGLASLTFVKYTQPLAAFCAAVLAGGMVDELRQGRGRARVTAVAGALIVALLVASRLLGNQYPNLWIDMNGAAILAIVIAAALAAAVAIPQGRRHAPGFILILILIDLVFASAANRPIMNENMAKKDMSAFREIIKNDPLARVATTADVLLPNQNLLVPMFDIGDHDALIVKESKELYQWDIKLSEDEIERKFMVFHSLRPDEEDLLKLSGVKYILTRVALPPNHTIKKIVDQGQLTTISSSYSYETWEELNDDMKESLFAHAPCKWKFAIEVAQFSAGISEKAWNSPGDGVWFSVIGGSKTGPQKDIYWSRYLDPRRQVTERGWIRPEDIEAYYPFLEFSTLPGSGNDLDWAYWGDIRTTHDCRREQYGPFWQRLPIFPYSNCRIGKYETIGKIKVYQTYDGVSQRMDAARRVQRVPNMTKLITSGKYGVPLEPLGATLASIGEDSGSVVPGWYRGGRTELVEYGLQKLSYTFHTFHNPDDEYDAFLVLEDAYYPGWKAFVNGEEHRIYRTNHASRGVEVPPGDSAVEFVYEPVSFRVGLWATLVSIIVFLCASVSLRLKKS